MTERTERRTWARGPRHQLAPKRAFFLAFLTTIAALAILAELNGSVSTGWRMFVLDRVFKAAWAVSVAILAAAASQIAIAALVGGPWRSGARGLFRDFAAIVLSIVVAIGALDYLLPDWTRLTLVAGACTLILWVVAVIAAL